MTNTTTLLLSGLLGLGLVFSPMAAHAEYRDLCDSTKVCEYTGPNAPALGADVCLNATGQVRLKGSSPCALGSVPFHVRHGEVYDAVQQLVIAYTPLANACSQGVCESMPDNVTLPLVNEEVICCEGAICWPGLDCDGTLFWCEDGVSNEDGTVTCFEVWEPPVD